MQNGAQNIGKSRWFSGWVVKGWGREEAAWIEREKPRPRARL